MATKLKKIINALRKDSDKSSKEMAHSLTGYKRKGYLKGRVDLASEILALMAQENDNESG